jgi:hypothetical protein
MLNKLKYLFAPSDDEQPKFRPWIDRPDCSVKLVGENILIFMSYYQSTSNHYVTRLDLPASSEEIARHIFDALANANNPGPGGTAGDPPYYVVAAGLTDPRKFHKSASDVGISWIKKPHQAGSKIWQPGVYLSPSKRERRVGSGSGLGSAYNRGPIPPEDHARIGREVMELFKIIREEFGG